MCALLLCLTHVRSQAINIVFPQTGTTSLHEAVLTGKDEKLIATLVKKGGNPKLVGANSKAEPILFSAARAQNKRLLQMLIEAGADMSQLDEDGRSIMVPSLCQSLR